MQCWKVADHRASTVNTLTILALPESYRFGLATVSGRVGLWDLHATGIATVRNIPLSASGCTIRLNDVLPLNVFLVEARVFYRVLA